jgi:hypothetical protein
VCHSKVKEKDDEKGLAFLTCVRVFVCYVYLQIDVGSAVIRGDAEREKEECDEAHSSS